MGYWEKWIRGLAKDNKFPHSAQAVTDIFEQLCSQQYFDLLEAACLEETE